MRSAACSYAPTDASTRWARWAAPAASLLFYVPTLLATLSVLQPTPASPPWHANLGPRAEVTQPEFALRVARPSGETLIETSGPLRFTTVTKQESPFGEGVVAPWTDAGTVTSISCDATSLNVELISAN